MINSRHWSIVIILLFMCTTARADDAKHLFILSGQSNMRQPLPASFKECVSAVFGEDRVIVVTVAQPSQPIKMWYKDWKPPMGMTNSNPERNGKLYDTLLASVTFVWMQGEADAGSGWGGVYERSFFGVLDQFKHDLQLDKINFVIGRINDFYVADNGFKDGDLVRSIQQKMGEEHANGEWVDTDDLNKGVNPWGGFSFADGHFPPPGYRVMGQRFAKRACLLIDPKMELDPQPFKEQFMDSSDDIAGHAAIGKAITGTKPSAKSEGAKRELAALLDGRFGEADLEKSEWLEFAPSEEGVELTVDLGKPMEVSSIAINLLFSSKASANFPAKIEFSASENGTEFKKPPTRQTTVNFNSKLMRQAQSEGLEPQSLLVLVGTRLTAIRSIKVRVETKQQRLFVDEVMVNPIAK